MSRGKYLSLEEARNQGKIRQFSKEHPAQGDKRAVLDTIRRMSVGRAHREKDK